MALLGRLPKNGAQVTAPKLKTGGTLQGVDGADDVQINNALQLVDRLELSPNTRAKARQSIALNIAENGQDVVLGRMAQEMASFKKYRDDALNAFASQGQEAPPELITRLDELEKQTGQRIMFQSLRKQEAAQLSGAFDVENLVGRELDTRLEIDDFIRPVTTAKLQLEFQQDLIKTAQAGASLRTTQIDNTIKEREVMAEDTFGNLDALFPNPTAKELEGILRSGVVGRLGVDPALAGRWARERMSTYLQNTKLEAEIAAKRATTSNARASAADKQRKTNLDIMLHSLTTGKLRALTQELTENGGATNVGGLTITATDAAKALDTRLTLGKQTDEFTLKLVQSGIDEATNNANLDRFEKLNQWYTGTRENSVTRNAEMARQTAINQIEATFPEGVQRQTAIAKVNEQFTKNNAELIEDAKLAIEANASDYDKRLAEEFVATGSVSFTNDVTDAIANNPNFANVIDQSSVFADEARLFNEMIEVNTPEGLGIDGTAENLFDVTTSARDVKQFLDADFVAKDGKQLGLTNRQMLRRARHGSVQGVAALKKAETAAADNFLIEATLFNGTNTSGAPVFTPSGQINPAYRTGDGEFNFYKVMLEMHRNASDEATPNEGVLAFANLMKTRFSSLENGDNVLAQIESITKPNDREEALLSSLTQGEFRGVNGGEVVTMSAQQDVAIMLGRDFEENADKAYRDYVKLVKSLSSETTQINDSAVNTALAFAPGLSLGGSREELREALGTQTPAKTIEEAIEQAVFWSPNPEVSNGR